MGESLQLGQPVQASCQGPYARSSLPWTKSLLGTSAPQSPGLCRRYVGEPCGARGRGIGVLVPGEIPGKTGPPAPQPVSLMPAAPWICIWCVWGMVLISSNLSSRSLQSL